MAPLYPKAFRDLTARRRISPIQITLGPLTPGQNGTICVPAADQQFFATNLSVHSTAAVGIATIRDGTGTLFVMQALSNAHGVPLDAPDNDPFVWSVGGLPNVVNVSGAGTVSLTAKGFLESNASA